MPNLMDTNAKRPCRQAFDLNAHPPVVPPFAPERFISKQAANENKSSPFLIALEPALGRRAAPCSSQAWPATACTERREHKDSAARK